jgi:hypothetical protein
VIPCSHPAERATPVEQNSCARHGNPPAYSHLFPIMKVARAGTRPGRFHGHCEGRPASTQEVMLGRRRPSSGHRGRGRARSGLVGWISLLARLPGEASVPPHRCVESPNPRHVPRPGAGQTGTFRRSRSVRHVVLPLRHVGSTERELRPLLRVNNARPNAVNRQNYVEVLATQRMGAVPGSTVSSHPPDRGRVVRKTGAGPRGRPGRPPRRRGQTRPGRP